MPRYLRHRNKIRHMRHDRHDKLATIKTVGGLQFSTNGTTWVDAIPAGTMKVATALNFYVRAKPTTVLEADTGLYQYNFKMATAGSGGLSLINGKGNVAHITGQTPSDQVGQTFSVNVTVIDKKGNKVSGTALTQVWVA